MSKIKGEYKIELRDAKTGRLTDERVGHNFVTEFTDEQFKSYGGRQPLASYSLDGFFGGIMCFDSAINENTDMTGNHNHPIFAPASKNMTANGCISYSESSASVTELGAYNTTESVANNGRSRRYVYDWDTNEGNGTIGCVCLTSEQGGWKGVGNKTSGRQLSASANQVGYGYYDFNYAGGLLNTYRSSTSETITGSIAYIKGNKIGILYSRDDITSSYIKIREYDYPNTLKNPFNANGDYFTYARYEEKTYALREYNIDNNKITGVGCGNGYWYVFRRSNNQVLHWVIDIFDANDNHESYYIEAQASVIEDGRNGNFQICVGLVKKNGYLIFTTSYGGGNLWIWAYNIATTELIALQAGSTTGGSAGNDYKRGLYELEDVIYCDMYVIKFVNGQPTLYNRNCNVLNGANYSYLGQVYQDLTDPYRIYIKNTGNNFFGAVGLPDIWLSTIANLSSPVTKTADKTMKITYTLTLQEE